MWENPSFAGGISSSLRNLHQGGACAEVCPPGNISNAPNPSPQFIRTHQIFGLFNDLNAHAGDAFLTQGTPVLGPGEVMITPLSEYPTWWQIDLWATEVRRSVAAGQVPALLKDAINNDGVCNTKLKARLKWETTSARILDVDIGTGVHLSILASSVSISLLWPEGHGYRLAGPLGPQPLLGPGIVTDTLVSASAYPSLSPVGTNNATFTQYIAQNLGDPQVDIPVPCGAKFVSIWKSPFQNLSIELQWRQEAGSFPQSNGLIFSGAHATDTTAFKEPVPQVSDTLRIPFNSTGGIAGYTVQWHLEY